MYILYFDCTNSSIQKIPATVVGRKLECCSQEVLSQVFNAPKTSQQEHT